MTYLTPELALQAKWLQGNVDWYRNRVVIHSGGFEKEGFHIQGVKSRSWEHVRTFIRARSEANGVFKEVDKESETLEVSIEHLCRYVEAVVNVLEQNDTESVLHDPTRPRKMAIAWAEEQRKAIDAYEPEPL